MTTRDDRLRSYGLPVLIAIALVAAAAAQSVDPAVLLKPPVDSWLTYHGDYTGQRHTKLSAITPENVHQLTLAWAFQTGQKQSLKMSPVLANGVIYLTAPDNVWAIDARSARQLWRYTHPTNDAFHIGQRGVAVYKDLGLCHDARRASRRSGCARRQGEARHRDCRRETWFLVDQRAAGHPQSHDRRRGGRLRQSAGHFEVVRSRYGQAAVDVLQHAASRHARIDRAAAPLADRCG